MTSIVIAGRRKFHFNWHFKTETEKIVAGVADLVRGAGSMLRICDAVGCPKVGYVAERRHALFCGHECQQREMNRRKAVSRKAARATRRQGETDNG
jgi:hypothetical protein